MLSGLRARLDGVDAGDLAGRDGAHLPGRERDDDNLLARH
jgi:hypothetical protein